MKMGTLEVNGNVFLAPMAGITDTALRKVVQQFGVSAVRTEMMSAQGQWLELRRRISVAGVSSGRTGSSDAACGGMVWPRDGSGVNHV